MKKALSFAVALGLVAGMASSAMAEDMLTVKGDARIRGLFSENTVDADSKSEDNISRMDQRMRLDATVKINDDVKVNTRLVVSNDYLGGPAPNKAMTFMTDRASISINMLGGSWDLGRQNASWGNKFFGWNSGVDRIKGTYKNGDMTYGGYLQKNAENTNYADVALAGNNNGDGDKDTWAAFLITKAAGGTVGALLNYDISDVEGATKGDTGYKLDLFFTGKAGAADLKAELLYKGGDLNENADGDSVLGGFVGAEMKMDAMTLKGLIAYFDGNQGSAADNDFAPSLLIGTASQETAIVDFGGTTVAADDATTLIGIGADMKVDDKLTVGALIGQLDSDCGASDFSLTEIDLTLNYALAANTTYSAGIAYGMWDGKSAIVTGSNDDDEAFVFGHRINVAW